MINNSHPNTKPSNELCSFVRNHIGLNEEAIQLGIRQSLIQNAPFPIVLLNLGLIDLSDYEKILDWNNKN